MPIEVRMPAVTPSMTEGSIARWIRQEGDPVKTGDVLLEIETDKAVVEVEARNDGVLGRIVVPEGTVGVKVDTVIALLAVGAEDVKALVANAPAGSAPEPAAPTLGAPGAAAASAIAAAPAAQRRDPGGRIYASPLARRIAKEMHVDLARVVGSGPNGRVIKSDVELAAHSAAMTATPVPAVAAAGGYEDIAHSNMRRVIAQRLGEAKRTIPHFYLSVDCNVDALLEARRQANELLDGVKLSVNDFVIKAAAVALRKMPAVNAAWLDNAIRRYDDVDISVAVVTLNGLITPVLRGVDRKSLTAISQEMRALAARARDSKLRPDEYQGGGFTISNLGMYGVREFAAIINPPQACILAVGAAEQRPVVRAGALAVASVMTVTLSVDHRAVDGALGGQFLAFFKKVIEAPIAMLV